MGLEKCPVCRGSVSSSAKSCPHCGHPMTAGRSGLNSLGDTLGCLWTSILLIIGLVIIIGVIGMMTG